MLSYTSQWIFAERALEWAPAAYLLLNTLHILSWSQGWRLHLKIKKQFPQQVFLNKTKHEKLKSSVYLMAINT